MPRWLPPLPFRRRRTPVRARGVAGRRPPRDAGRFVLAPAPRPRPPRHIPWRRIFTSVAAVTLTAAATYGVAWLLMSDTLRVREIHVTGTQVTDARAVAESSGLGGDSLLWLDAEAAAARIAELPAVKAARVVRRWPQAVAVEVTEHQAWGYWQAGGMRVVIDEDGRPLAAARPPAPDAPTIVEVGPRSATANPRPDVDTVRLVARLTSDGTLERLRVRPSAYLFKHDRGLTVVVEDGPDAVFGDSTNYGFKVATWSEVLRRHRAEALAARELDLRFGSQVVLR
jgi:cell division protein FtsQ